MKINFLKIGILFFCLLSSGIYAQMTTLNVGGRTRSLLVYAPAGILQNRPLVISLHGLNQDINYQKNQAKWELVADTAKFVVVYPAGEGNSWDISGNKDTDFILAIIESMVTRYGINRNKVYVSGFSMGGMMSYHVANKLANKVTAIGPVSGYLFANPVSSSRPMPIMHVHGTADDVVNYSGVAAVLQKWRNWNQCPSNSIRTNPYPANKPNSRAYLDYWGPCNNSSVSLITLEGKGHWHSNDANGVNTTNELWNFFRRQSLGNSNTPPTVSLTSPLSNASFTAPASITIAASASDADGTISNVQFYNGTTLLGADASSPYSFVWSNVTVGTYSITARATDNSGAVTTSSAISVTVTNPVVQAPFNGTPATIPGTIQAENYDTGGQGVAFNETTAGNSGNSFRTDNVDIEATADNGGGYNIGWIASGEWLEYTVNVTTAGTYNIEARVASQNAGTSFHIEMDGVNISGVIAVPVTGGWQTFQTVSVTNIALTAGQKVMRIAMDASWFNINYVAFSPATTNPNVAPTVSITAPVNNSSYTAPASIAISALAADSDGTVSNVQFYNGNTLLGADATSPYGFSWTNVAAGTYSITAKATDNRGATTTSAVISITVAPALNKAPTINITAPANNASFNAPASISITASASDADGTISNVQFYNGTTLLGSDATSPYSFVWTSVAAGTYSITAKATDNAGAATTSAAITIVVNTVSTADIIGPDCGSNNTTISFSLNASNRANATSYNWWYTGSAASTTMVTGAPYSANIQTGPNFSAGQVCVGVNISVAPWYVQFCKSVTYCSGNKEAAENLDLPVSESSTEENIYNITILNTMGVIVYSGKDVSIQTDNDFASGIYNVFIQYSGGRTETKKIQIIK